MHEAIVKALENGGDLNKAIVEAAGPMRKLIEDAFRRTPFLPFRLHLTGGSVYEFRDPERVQVGPSTVTLGEPDPANKGKLRDRAILALIHVVEIEPLLADEPAIVGKGESRYPSTRSDCSEGNSH